MSLAKLLQSKMADVQAGKTKNNFIDLGKNINLNWEDRLQPGGVWSLDVGSLDILEDNKEGQKWFKKKYPGKTLNQVNKTRVAKEYTEHILSQLPEGQAVQIKGHAIQSQNKPGTEFGKGATGKAKDSIYNRWWADKPGFRTHSDGSLVYEKPKGGVVAETDRIKVGRGYYKKYTGSEKDYKAAARKWLDTHPNESGLEKFFQKEGILTRNGQKLKPKGIKNGKNQVGFRSLGDNLSAKLRADKLKQSTLRLDDYIDYYLKNGTRPGVTAAEQAAFDYINDVKTREALKTRIGLANEQLVKYGADPKKGILSYEHFNPITEPLRGGFEHRLNVGEVMASPNYAKSDFTSRIPALKEAKTFFPGRSSLIRASAQQLTPPDDATRFKILTDDIAANPNKVRSGKRLKRLESLRIPSIAARHPELAAKASKVYTPVAKAVKTGMYNIDEKVGKTVVGRVGKGILKKAGKFIPVVSTGITSAQAHAALRIAARNPTFANKAFAAARSLEAGLDLTGAAASASLVGAPVGFAAEIGSLLLGFGTDAAQAIHSSWNPARNIPDTSSVKGAEQALELKPRPVRPTKVNSILGVVGDVAEDALKVLP